MNMFTNVIFHILLNEKLIESLIESIWKFSSKYLTDQLHLLKSLCKMRRLSKKTNLNILKSLKTLIPERNFYDLTSSYEYIKSLDSYGLQINSLDNYSFYLNEGIINLNIKGHDYTNLDYESFIDNNQVLSDNYISSDQVSHVNIHYSPMTSKPDIDDKPNIVFDITKDGNCFFNCLSLYLNMNQNHHFTIREQIIEHAKNNTHVFGQLFSNNFENYLLESNMNRQGTWATDIEIIIAAHLFEKDINVFSNNSWQFFKSTFLDNDRTSNSNINIYLSHDHFELISEVSKEHMNANIVRINNAANCNKSLQLTTHDVMSKKNCNIRPSVTKKKRNHRGKSKKLKNKTFTQNTNTLSCIYFNAKGAFSKRNSIQSLIDFNCPDIIAISETWFRSWIPKFDNYVWIHNLRKGKKGGGVSFLLKKEIYDISTKIESDENIETLWVSIMNKKKTCVLS